VLGDRHPWSRQYNICQNLLLWWHWQHSRESYDYMARLLLTFSYSGWEFRRFLR